MITAHSGRQHRIGQRIVTHGNYILCPGGKKEEEMEALRVCVIDALFAYDARKCVHALECVATATDRTKRECNGTWDGCLGSKIKESSSYTTTDEKRFLLTKNNEEKRRNPINPLTLDMAFECTAFLRAKEEYIFDSPMQLWPILVSNRCLPLVLTEAFPTNLDAKKYIVQTRGCVHIFSASTVIHAPVLKRCKCNLITC